MKSQITGVRLVCKKNSFRHHLTKKLFWFLCYLEKETCFSDFSCSESELSEFMFNFVDMRAGYGCLLALVGGLR